MTSKKKPSEPTTIKFISAEQVAFINKRIADQNGTRYQCYDLGKIESALSTAFYPGQPPFEHGGVATTAGALCFYVAKAHAFFDGNKRTALEASATFMRLNGFQLVYFFDVKTGENALADLIEKCASSVISKEQMMIWHDTHKKGIF